MTEFVEGARAFFAGQGLLVEKGDVAWRGGRVEGPFRGSHLERRWGAKVGSGQLPGVSIPSTSKLVRGVSPGKRTLVLSNPLVHALLEGVPSGLATSLREVGSVLMMCSRCRWSLGMRIQLFFFHSLTESGPSSGSIGGAFRTSPRDDFSTQVVRGDLGTLSPPQRGVYFLRKGVICGARQKSCSVPASAGCHVRKGDCSDTS